MGEGPYLQPLPLSDPEPEQVLPPASTATEPRQPVQEEQPPETHPVFPAPVPVLEPDYPVYNFWFGYEFLLWRVPRNPLAVPLLTIGPIGAGLTPPGALGESGTQILFDDESFHDGTYQGYRLSAGWWFTPDQLFGVEASYFNIESQGLDFFVPSTFTLVNATSRPVINAQTGESTVVLVNFLQAFRGTVEITAGSRLRSFDTHLIGALYQTDRWDFDLLLGYRYTDLTEGLTILQNSLVQQGGAAFFVGQPVAVSSTIFISDRFRTTNEFQGGQVGLRSEWRFGRTFLCLTGKLALGMTDQVIDIQGTTTLVPASGSPTSVPAGVLALASNSGRVHASTFTVLPEFNLKIGVDLCKCLRVHVGYDSLLWNKVVRPGNQISNIVNLSQVPTSSTFGTLVGPALPQVFIRESTLWIQGINMGMEWRF
jgi:hypothetical protein